MIDSLKEFVESIPKLYAALLANKITVDDLQDYAGWFRRYADDIITAYRDDDKKTVKKFSDTIKPFIMMCMDYYTYSSYGGVLIPDTDYDMVMRAYVNMLGHDPISTADILANSTTWGFKKHEAPFMVGTVSKIYELEELKEELKKFRRKGYNKILYAPKFDGNSSVIKVENGRVTMAMTRNDGVSGQDITPLIQQAAATTNRFIADLADGYYKTEVLVSQAQFNMIIQAGRSYANRRSATSAIVANPSNQDLAPYITVMPLAWCNFDGRKTKYLAAEWASDMLVKPDTSFDIVDVYDNICAILDKIRDPEYPYRTDGVVLYPIRVGDYTPNTSDLMGNAIAFKINTKENTSRAQKVWIQVGRLGRVTPMVGVEPVEVNETIVTKASLSSIPKFESFHLHEGEKITVFSAGDVIPQTKMPEIRSYPPGAKLFKLDLTCPYCGEQVKPMYKGAEVYKCKNPDCPRVITGRMTNFVKTLGIKGISDHTIEDLYEARVIHHFEDVLDLDSPEMVNKISTLEFYGERKAQIIADAITEIKRKPIEASVLMGALGIDQVKIKTCQMILAEIDFDRILHSKKKDLLKALLNIDGINWATAEAVSEFMDEHHDEVLAVCDKLNTVGDVPVKGNVVFTGFRNAKYAEEFKNIGYPVSESVNKNTVVVIYSGDNESTKCKKARAKGIDVVHFGEIDDVYDYLKKH